MVKDTVIEADALMVYGLSEGKSEHELRACFKHATKLEPLKWLPKNPCQYTNLGCDVCAKGLKKATRYAETGWAD